MNQHKTIYAEILKGYTTAQYRGRTIFIKHLTPYDNAELDIEYDKHYQKALASHLETREQRFETLREEGQWTEDNEREIINLAALIKNNKKAKEKIVLPSQVKILQDEIDKNSQKLRRLENRKESLVGITAESYARKKSNEYYIYKCIFSDPEFRKRAIPWEEWDHLADEELGKIIEIYNERSSRIDLSAIKTIALSPFFLNGFSVSGDEPFYFYGKAMCDLTFYQTDLFIWGRKFKHILQTSNDIPPDIEDDPEKLLEWFDNKERIVNNTKGSDLYDQDKNVFIPGATNQDMKDLGLDDLPGTINLAKEARKRGKNLNMNDIFELQHGVRPRGPEHQM